MRNMDREIPDFLARTKWTLLKRLRALAIEKGVELLDKDQPMRVAEAYRAQKDAGVALVDAEPSEDEAVAIARALVMQGGQEVMAPHYRAVRVARAGAVKALEGLEEMRNGLQALRALHQVRCPLYAAEPLADLGLVLLPDALTQMPEGPSKLARVVDEYEAMIMNMTRQLSKALGAAAIAGLIDDGGDRRGRRPMDRVRRRLEALVDWSNGNTEIAYFPPGWQDPRGG